MKSQMVKTKKKKMTEVEKLEALSRRVEAKLLEARKNQHIKCEGCSRKNHIKDLTLEVETYYVEPAGCTDGDYWTTGRKPDYAIACPHCKLRTVYREYHDKGWDFEYANRNSDKYVNRYEPLNETALISNNICLFKGKREYYYENGTLYYHEKKEPDDLY
jgi:hypothetical protein